MSDYGALVSILERAQGKGFLGPGPVEDHVLHARAYREAGLYDQIRALDLGSGAGVPGIVLAVDLPGSRWVLLDANQSRTAFLATAVAALHLGDRVHVVTGRAEEVGRDPAHRGCYDAVVARAFARPAVVAECAAPLLAAQGLALVSEPPQGSGRWPPAELSQLGLRLLAVTPGPPRIARLRQGHPCPERFPRRVGVPSKRPLW